jgi:hypothetical protein
MNTFKWLVLFQLTMLFYNVKGQSLPIEIINNKVEYGYHDSLNVIIINKDTLTYSLTVGLEKFTEYSLWEEITDNILLSRSQIEGRSKGGLSYRLLPLKTIKIKIPINQINIPIAVKQDSPRDNRTLIFRLSPNSNNNPILVLSGRFRFSIKCTNDLYKDEYMVIKTKSFNIK